MMNDSVILARFSVTRGQVLMADYYLPFEEGELPYQIVKSLRVFGQVVMRAIREREHDTDHLVK